MSRLGILITFLLTTLAAPAAEPEKKPAEEIKPPEVLAEFKIAKGGRAIIVPVTIKGEGYHFVLDSWAGRTLFDSSFGPRTGLFEEPDETVSFLEAQTSNGIVKFAAFPAPELLLGKLKLRQAGSAPLHDFALIRRVYGRDFRGILGMDALKSCVVRLNFDNGAAAFLRPSDREHLDWGSVLPLTYESHGNPMVAVEVPGAGKVELGVDTGSNSTVLTSESFAKAIGKGPSVQHLATTAAGTTGGRTIRLESLSLGPFNLTGVLCDEGDLPLLGLDVLSRFVVTLDFPAGKMYLKKGRDFARVDEMDMSGLHLWVVDKKVSVHSVDKNSPAEGAGIKPEDVVLKGNDKLTADMDIEDLRDLLKSGDGKEIKMTIKRGDEEKAVSFKLKKRI